MSQTVADVLVAGLERVGVKQIFGLIGDSLNPLADAIRSSRIEWVGVRHEEGAALAAAGQAKLTGRLAVCAGTTGPGSTHLVAGLYEASRDHAPVLALSGDMPRKMQGIDFIQTTKPDLLFRDVSLYTETVSSPEQAPGVIHQAIAAAYAGRGVAHLTLPQDVIAARASGGISSVETLKPRTEFAANEQDIAEIARRVDQADSVAIMCGAACMLMCEFMTAVHHKLPVKVVIYNNSAFGLIPLEAEAAGLPPFREGIEFPNPDFAALARACGGRGCTARKPGELEAAIGEAFAVDGPAIVDAVAAADELPNLPHVDLETIGRFALAKVKEAVLEVAGA